MCNYLSQNNTPLKVLYAAPKPSLRLNEDKTTDLRTKEWNNVTKVTTRSAFRIKSYPEVRRDDIGFRIARSL